MNRLTFLIWICLVTVISGNQILAQTGTVKGFVYDAADGQSIPIATVTISGTQLGQMTDANGFFIITRIPAGMQTIRVSFVGYNDQVKELEIRDGALEQVAFYLTPRVIEIQAATINAERRRLEKTNAVSLHHLTQATLRRIPGLTGKADLAEYLQVLPGVIFTGDKGGQFYIRGGAPVNNLVRLDGMTVISPFHSIGFSSVFDTEIIGSADVFTAGYGASYGSRISSVIDVRTRMGNRREFKANATASTFGYGLLVEGPIKKMTTDDPSSVSFILSNKGSYIRTLGKTLYPYLDSTGLPYRYDDYYGKLTLVGRKGDQLDLIGMHFTDNSDYGSLIRSTWKNTGGGARFLISPRGTNILFESSLFASDYRGELAETGLRPRNTRYNALEGSFRIHFNGPMLKILWGTELNMISTEHSFLGVNGITVENNYYTTELITYLDSRIETGRFLFEPGIRLHYYADQSYFSPEPRLKVKFKITEPLSLNLAGGIYSQNLVSTTSPEDVVNIFQGYYSGPFWVQDYYKGEYVKDKIQLAWHAVSGLTWLGGKNLRVTLEGYYKDFYRLINYNRNKIFDEVLKENDIPEYLKKHFIIEKGQAYGIDLLADWNHDDFNLYLAYSLGFVTREDEFIAYVPHYDRRHNLNLVGGYLFGVKKNWELKLRWNMGSGFPFTQSFGLYEDLALSWGELSPDPAHSGDLSIWFGPINEGRLPWYHRLDLSVTGTWKFRGDHQLEAAFSILNVYNRANVFYFDRISYSRIDQLPIMPMVSMTYRF